MESIPAACVLLASMALLSCTTVENPGLQKTILAQTLVKAVPAVVDGETMRALVGRADISKALVRHEILRLADASRLSRLAATPQGRRFLAEFLADQAWMESFLCSGSVGDAALSLQYLADIWACDAKGLKTPLYRDLATATALAYTAPRQSLANTTPKDTPRERYLFFKQSHTKGKLHPSFDTMKAWEMRYLIPGPDNASLAWVQDNIHVPLSRFVVAEGCTAYLGMNTFGNDIHGGGAAPGFHGPWRMAGQNDAENFYRHGGVCGTQSAFGSYVAVSRGIPAFPVGQGSHCAYAVRLARHHWAGGFGGPGGGAFQGIYGTNSPYDPQLVDALFTDSDAVLASRRLAWLGALLQSTDITRARAALHAAIEAQSLNVESWQDYVDHLFATEKQLQVDWQAVLDQLITSDSFRLYPSARGFALFDTVYARAVEKLAGEARLKVLVKAYEACAEGYCVSGLQGLRQQQFNSLPTRPLQVQFAKALMRTTWKTENLNETWRWINQCFVGKPDEEEAMLEILNQTFEPHPQALHYYYGNGEYLGLMVATIEAHWDNPKAVLVMKRLQQADWKPFYTDELKQVEAVNRTIPAHPALSGELLSEGGMIHMSSDFGSKALYLTHPGLLTPAGGKCQTRQELKPSVTVRLGKPGTLSGIVITPLFENEGWGRRPLPLTIFISDDNKSWTNVTTITEYRPIWMVKLEGKGLKAAYVKLESDHTTSNYPEHLQLHQILVYGTPTL